MAMCAENQSWTILHTRSGLVRASARGSAKLQVGLAPAELGELVGERVVVRLLRCDVLRRRLAPVGNRLEDGRDLRLERRAEFRLLQQFDDGRRGFQLKMKL